MAKFEIRYGLSGGFGGCEMQPWEVIEAKDMRAAEEAAYQSACDTFQSYEGCHGLRCIDDIMEEDGLSEDDAVFQYLEERESWLDYEARPYSGKPE